MRWSRLIVLASLAGLLAWLFAEALFCDRLFVFRDAAHYYYPLFQLVGDEWAAGRVPLWNPYENLGQPLAADPTASVFYPGKLIFALPLAYPWVYKLYILGHVLLAAGTAYLLARHFGSSIEAAGVCAISYAFGGSVLFQYCNVVFLVGAAWLPLAMLSADRMLRQRSPTAAVALAAVWAMMILGGDPQMACNAGLLTALYTLILWRRERGPLSLWERARVRVVRALGRPLTGAGPHPGPLPKGEGGFLLRSRPALLALAAGLALVLSAVQVLPSLEFARASTRQLGPLKDRLLGRPEAESFHEEAYHFSVGPWRLVEYLWPNFSGRQFPIHHRWINALPAEGRAWTPSLYMGLLPLLLALWAMRLRRGEPWQPWLSWTALLAVLAGFGWFGLGWLAQDVWTAAGGKPDALPVGPPFGGVYWLLTLLPGYGYFRYPAKLLVVAAMALSVLAAIGWDRAMAAPARLRHVLAGLCGLSLLLAGGAWAIRPLWTWGLAAAEPDVLFGPLDASGAFRDLLAALLHAAFLSALFWWLLRKRPATAVGGVAWRRQAALWLVAVDLAVANGWMVVCAPAEYWEKTPRMAEQIERDRAGQDVPPCRVYRAPLWLPPAWREHGSTDRLAESMQWDRDTFFPKYNLRPRIAVAEVHGSIMLSDYAALLSHAEESGAAWDALGAEYAIVPADQCVPGWQSVPVEVPSVSLWRNPSPRPRKGIVYYDPLRVEIEATLQQPGMVVLADQFYPGWQLEVSTAGGPLQRVPIVRVNRVMRGAWLPAGEHRLVYTYRPASFFCGAVLSGLGWIALGLWAIKSRNSASGFGNRACAGAASRGSPSYTARPTG